MLKPGANHDAPWNRRYTTKILQGVAGEVVERGEQ